MSSSIRIVHGVGVSENLSVVAVVVLNDDVRCDVRFAQDTVLGEFIWTPACERNCLGVEHLLPLAHLLDKFLNTIFVEKSLAVGVCNTFVQKRDFQAGIDKSQFAQPLG